MRNRKMTGTAAVTAAIVVASVIGSAGVAAAADEPHAPQHVAATAAEDAKTESLVNRANPFVSVLAGKFVLDEASASGVLSMEEIAAVKLLVQTSNEVVVTSVEAGAEATVSGPTVTLNAVTEQSMTAAAFTEGITKIEAHWYGFRVWLSRDTVRGIGGAVGVGAIWIPEPVVSKVLASLGGLTAAFAPGGIVFNYTPVSVPGFPAGAVWGSEFQ